MYFHKTILLTIIALFTLFILSACDLGTEPEQTVAAAVISAEFVDAETGEPISATNITIGAQFEDSGDIVEQGTITTNEAGSFETFISAPQEIVITQLQFTFLHNNETVELQEDVSLSLTFEEPYDEVNLNFLIENNSGEENE